MPPTYPPQTKPKTNRSPRLEAWGSEIETDELSTPVRTQTWSKPRDVEQEEVFDGEIQAINGTQVLALLKDSNGVEYRAMFSTNEFVPGFAIFPDLKFRAHRYATVHGEQWINQPEAWSPPEPVSVVAGLKEIDSVLGDSGY